MARKLTPLQAEYSKQIRRIKSFVRRATKRGFIFPENLIPQRPDKIRRKDVEKLKEMTAPSMYKEAQYVEPSTGEVVSGYQGRKSERRKAYYKGRQRRKLYKPKRYEQYAPPEEMKPAPYLPTQDSEFYADSVILNFKSILAKFNAKGAWVLSTWIENLIFKYGKAEVAVMLEAGAQMGVIVTYEVIYEEQMTRNYMADMVKYISSIEPDDIGTYGQDFYDALEEDDGYVMV